MPSTAADDSVHYADPGDRHFDLDHHALNQDNATGKRRKRQKGPGNSIVALSAGGRKRQDDAKDRSASGVLFGPDAAVMRLDDGVADRQADAHAGPFGRDKRLKQPLANVVG